MVVGDANAAALGEALAGAAKGAQSCVCITLGTGVGGGIIIDGKIYGGFNFAGAELGHTVIMVDGELCTCGRFGCWEAYASATALINQTRRAMVNHPDSAMWSIAEDLDKVNGRTAFDGMRAGDAVAAQVVDTYIKYIATGLINVINIFQPEVLCIGGGICKEGDTLLKPLAAHIERERYSKYSRPACASPPWATTRASSALPSWGSGNAHPRIARITHTEEESHAAFCAGRVCAHPGVHGGRTGVHDRLHVV